MIKLRIRNLRSLEDTGPIELRPLTLLVGKNSSGKSTLLRALPLLRQSIEVDTAGPLLWFGRYVDFGSFVEAVRSGAEPREVVFELSFAVDRPRRRRASTRALENMPLTVSLTLSGDATTTTASKLELSLFDHRVSLSFGKENAINEFRVNDLDVLSVAPEYRSHQGTNLLPIVWPTRRSGESGVDRWESRGINRKLISQLITHLRPYFHWRTGTTKRTQVAAQLDIGSSTSMLDYLKRNAFRTSTYFRNQVAHLTTESSSFQQIRDLAVANSLPMLLLDANEVLSDIFRSVSYTAPLRAATERYYRAQGLAVEEIDPRGANLAMYLSQLSSSERQSLDEWTSQHLGVRVVVSQEGGHTSLHLKEDKSDAHFNLADLGFGFSQLLPVLTHIWGATTKTWETSRPYRRRYRQYLEEHAQSILAIEQPELHLHPGMQARVADLLVALIREAKQRERDIALIIETHSEVIVNRIGEWVSREGDDGIPATDCQILVFDKDAVGASQIQQATYSDQGFLENWPYGFFEPEA